jgi:hypothetical protein
MIKTHDEFCPCCICSYHNTCLPLRNPRWVCLMAHRVNEIHIGPLNYLRSDCLLEIKENYRHPFRIVNKYIYPNFLTGLITLIIVANDPHIIKPGELLGSVCVLRIQDTLKDLEGKLHHKINKLFIFFYNLLF